ncbi:hypothetical protein [Pontibacter sp. G13]|uniref:hypothetical protein n=1 Tax=Pontibacter sp. G13 TaxID=3074898 RepID=UPI00288C5073|nr:hypothetical protein [Pontibacter sp. G13]WNJ17353.1 hypothetical protein RJD25_21090 [Pontibacter sp. G13]
MKAFVRPKTLGQIFALALFMTLSACEVENEFINTDELEGVWILTLLDGEPPTTTLFTWDFDSDFDFLWCENTACFAGEYNWSNSNTEIDMEFNDGGVLYEARFEVESLDSTSLVGAWFYNGDQLSMEFTKFE